MVGMYCVAVLLSLLLLQENEAWAALLAEISAEAGQVAQFLIDREIEAPERYSAVQSYRVAMAVLRQQRLFVEVSAAVQTASNTQHDGCGTLTCLFQCA